MMKKILPLCFGCMALALHAQGTTRTDSLFNFGWKFHHGEAEHAESPAYNDADWRILDLPHDFQIEQPWVEAAGGARGFKEPGVGWYRKSFRPSPTWKGRRVLLDFDGIIYYGDVWLNGVKVGSTEYGYIGLETELTRLLHYDRDNVVAVRASTAQQGASRWYTGGGLFRDVRLVVKDSVAVARNGLYITTPDVSAATATVQLQVEMDGVQGNRSKGVSFLARVYDPQGKLVGEVTAPMPASNLRHAEVKLPLIRVARPELWSCEQPSLYRAEVSVLHEGRETDRVSDEFGIRRIEFSPEFGLRLNGKKVFLKGIAIHHDMGALGAAAFDTGAERLFKQLKRFGFNHVRTSHNPYSDGFMRLADRYGILVVDELIDKWSDTRFWGGRVPFTALWYKLIPNWIKRDRNRASVVLWSLGNELQMDEEQAGFPTGDWGVTTYKVFDVMVKRYDASRKTTVAMFPSYANSIPSWGKDAKKHIAPPELSLVTEVASYNYLWTDYNEYLRQAPHLTIYQSEATSNELAAPFFGMDRERMVGLAYWGAVAYWGESNGWPKKGWNYSFFDHTLEPRPQAHLLKSAFEETPAVRIGILDNNESEVWNDVLVGSMSLSSHWNRPEGSRQQVFTFTNADEVELFANGRSLGIKGNDRSNVQKRNVILWDNVPYGKGGSLVAVARNGGKEVARHRIETAGRAVALRVEVENEAWKADGMSLQYLRVYAIDSKGRVVPSASQPVTFTVEGEAHLLATDNGDQYTSETFLSPTRALHGGFVMGIIRSTHRAGKVRVRLASEGMKPVTLQLRTLPNDIRP